MFTFCNSLSLCLITLLFNPGDASARRNADEKEIDKRVAEAIEMEDPHILLDLKHQNVNGSDKYRVF